MLYGPYRVLPGRLSVSRTFGDIEAKFEKFGGVVSAPGRCLDVYKLLVL